MKIENQELTIRPDAGTFSLVVDGEAESEQALDLASYVLRYVEPAMVPVVAPTGHGALAPEIMNSRYAATVIAARAFADAHEAHQRARSGATGKAKIRATAALLAAVKAARS